MIHTLRLHPNPFKLIKEGKKTIELRLNDEKRSQIKIDDIIIFERRPDFKEKLKVKVIGLLRYNSIRELVDNVDLSLFGYNNEYTKESFVDSYKLYYSKEKEEKYGALGIKIKVITQNI